MPTVVVVGAGPGLGFAIARRFGREGFTVGLIARRRAVLEEGVAALAAQGIDAGAFTADIADPAQLTAALDGVAGRFGPIDVLEFSPMPFTAMPTFTAAGTTPADIEHHWRVQTMGAVTAVRHVLPGMVTRGTGSILLTTGMSAVHPMALLTPIGMAMSAVRNYARSLHQELAPRGIYAATVCICTGIKPGTPGDPDLIADFYWQLHTGRNRADVCFPDVPPVA